MSEREMDELGDRLGQHLIDGHGVRYNWNAAGPCSDSPVGVHNRMHWADAKPNHTHQVHRGYDPAVETED